MFTASTGRAKRATYVRATVSCGGCTNPIHVQKIAGLADEFSLRCPKCGARRFYDKRAMTVEEMSERRRRPRR